MMMIITEGDSRYRVGCSDQTASPDWRFSQIVLLTGILSQRWL